MHLLQSLLNAHAIARFVLVGFVLSMAAAVASPMVKSPALELICSGAGAMTLMASADDGHTPTTSPLSHALDCPLCAAGLAPPRNIVVQFEPHHALVDAAKRTASSHLTLVCAAALPARGPPTLL
jgi:hypothetical protein